MHKPYGSQMPDIRKGIQGTLLNRGTLTIDLKALSQDEIAVWENELRELDSNLTGLAVIREPDRVIKIVQRDSHCSEDAIQEAVKHALREGWCLLHDVCAGANHRLGEIKHNKGRALPMEIIGLAVGKMIAAGKVEQRGLLVKLKDGQ